AEPIKVLSVDVFDTLLFRQVPEPVDAFELVGQRLGERGLLAAGTTPEVFARVRRRAEERARERSLQAGDGLEVTLAQVHAELPASLLARSLGPGELESIECEVEAGLLVADLDVLELVHAAQE